MLLPVFFYKIVLTKTKKTCIIIQVAERYGKKMNDSSLDWQGVVLRFAGLLRKKIKKFLTIKKHHDIIIKSLESDGDCSLKTKQYRIIMQHD